MIEVSTIYGPVESWRLGRSLGVDLLCITSACSLRCVYCQLGRINLHATERRVFVETRRVLADLGRSRWRAADVVTFSGSGEPTLAANLGECVAGVKALTAKPVAVLTNATLLEDPQVRRDLARADRVSCKLDAADEETFKRVGRPAQGLTLARVVSGIKLLRAEFPGKLDVQIMLTPLNLSRPEEFARILAGIGPDEVHLNAPTRPAPRSWSVASRGNLPAGALEAGASLRLAPREDALRFARALRAHTGLRITSAYERARATLA